MMLIHSPTDVKASIGQSRFDLLDPLRGVAAMLVVLQHLGVVSIGYFAVLAFFVISGYCISASAESATRSGMSFITWMKRRFRRIYPPYLASVIFFVITRLVKGYLSDDYTQIMRPLHVWIQNITLTQWVSLLDNESGYAYASDSLMVAAYWSLNYEEQFYIVVGLAMLAGMSLRVSLRNLLLATTAVTTAFMAFFPQLCVGIFFDYWPVFGVGVAIYYRTAATSTSELKRLIDLFLAIVLMAGIYWLVFGERPVPSRRFIWEDLLVASIIAIPLILIKPFDRILMKSLPMRLLQFVGTISFSLYLIHQFNIKAAATVADFILAPSTWRAGNVALQLAVHVAVAFVFWRLFERPFLNSAPKSVPLIPLQSLESLRTRFSDWMRLR